MNCSICGTDHMEAYAIVEGKPVCSVCLLTVNLCKSCSALTEKTYCSECEVKLPKCSYDGCNERDGLQLAFDAKTGVLKHYCHIHFHKLFGDSLSGHSSCPPLRFYSSGSDRKGKSYYMGIEIETEIAHEHVQTKEMFDSHRLSLSIAKTLKSEMFFYKRDGSLDSSGVEIVSHPFTFSFLKERGWREFNRVLRSYVSAGFSSFKSGRCGIHIHVSRVAFKDISAVQMWFEICQPWIEKIAQRRQNDYCKYSVGGDKYRAVNVSKSGTYEFRIFRGNLRPNRVLKNIEFVDAVRGFFSIPGQAERVKALYHSKVQTVSIGTKVGPPCSLEEKMFNDYVESHKDTYPYLYDFLNEEGDKMSGKEDNNVRDSLYADFDKCQGRNLEILLGQKQPRSRILVPKKRVGDLQEAVLQV